MIIMVDPVILSYVMTNPGKVVFAKWDNEFFQCIAFSPLFKMTAQGMRSYLCFYKGKKQGKYWYEPVKMRNEITFDQLQARFDAEEQRTRELNGALMIMYESEIEQIALDILRDENEL